jgi:ethylbenzene hydroxylase subunit beta/complex iron-sulfur molybdoenzyme family reductase subunit beta
MAKAPRVKRQLAAVFDLNKCLGCQTCTIACKTLWTDEEGMEYMWWNIVSTMPGQGTPKAWQEMGGGFRQGQAHPSRIPTLREFGEAWEFNYEEVLYGGQGLNKYLQPASGAAQWGPLWDEDQASGDYPNAYFFYLPTICMHCTRPACLAACPRSAIYKRVEDGIVLIDEERCHGYRFCMEACPYKRIYFNHNRRVAQKCVLCFPRLEQGVAPACFRQCPGRVRFIGYLDDEHSAVHKLVKKWRVALPLHPEFGTEPNVYYVPPLSPPCFDENGEIDWGRPRIPTEYLESLFGPEVHHALTTVRTEMEKTRRGEKSELMDILVSYRWKDMFGGFHRDPVQLKRPLP